MLQHAVVEISQPSAGTFTYKLRAEGEEFNFDGLKQVLEAVFGKSFVEAEFELEKVTQTIEHHGVFTMGYKP